MLKRVVCGLSISAVLLLLLLFGNLWLLVALALGIYFVAQHEFRLLAKAGNIPVLRWTVPLCGLTYLLALISETPFFRDHVQLPHAQRVITSLGAAPSETLLSLIPIILLVVCIVHRRTQKALETFAVSLASFWYLAVLLGFILRITLLWPDPTLGRIAILYTLLVVKMSDAGAYFIGMRFGRKGPRLLPEISPAKSVIGLAGGFLFGVLSSVLFVLGLRYTSISFPIPLIHAAILGIALTAAGCIGDLAESLFKRSVNVKDSASGIPGLGGILDMLDSPLFAAPILYFYLRIFLLP